MKRIDKYTLASLAEIQPQNCLLIRNLIQTDTGKSGFRIEGRLEDKRYYSYNDRIVYWDEYLNEPDNNIWGYIRKTEAGAVISDVCSRGAIACFLEMAGRSKAVAMTEQEFNEFIPELPDGLYSLFIERADDE